jgi:hypothetical protein
MKERGNYRTIGKVVRLYTKKIRGDQSDQSDQGLFILISMIIPILVGFSWSKDLSRNMKL